MEIFAIISNGHECVGANRLPAVASVAFAMQLNGCSNLWLLQFVAALAGFLPGRVQHQSVVCRHTQVSCQHITRCGRLTTPFFPNKKGWKRNQQKLPMATSAPSRHQSSRRGVLTITPSEGSLKFFKRGRLPATVSHGDDATLHPSSAGVYLLSLLPHLQQTPDAPFRVLLFLLPRRSSIPSCRGWTIRST